MIYKKKQLAVSFSHGEGGCHPDPFGNGSEISQGDNRSGGSGTAKSFHYGTAEDNMLLSPFWVLA